MLDTGGKYKDYFSSNVDESERVMIIVREVEAGTRG